MTSRARLEVFRTFLKLGLTSFGGPVAHLGYLRAECVERRRWLDDAEYADLVALCQFLPGPTSSQVVWGLGQRRAGLSGALVASLGFLAPSALLMMGFAWGLAAVGVAAGAPWLHGLKVAAVAVVAHAVWAMTASLCPDWPRRALALAAASLAWAWPGAAAQLGVILGGGLLGLLLPGGSALPASPPASATPRRRWPLLALAAFGVTLALPLALPPSTGAALFEACSRAGALVFGGGHVVLPLLREALVPAGLVTDDAFLAGYGAAQAVPGPLFSLAGYLGVVATGHAWGGLLALLAIFLPGWLLVSAALPTWSRLRALHRMQAALRGTNAAVVGLLLAALVSPVGTQGLRTPLDVAVALGAFALLQGKRAPAWLVVALSAAAGQWLLAP